MFEKAVQQLLRQYLREYLCVDEVALQRIVVSLWSGKLEIEDLQLESVALERLLGLQVATRKSAVRRLRVDVPWSALQSKPVVIRLEGIDIVAQPKEVAQDQASVDPDEAAAERQVALQTSKLQRLEKLETLEAGGAELAADDDLQDAKKSATFWEKLGTKILDNLQLVMEDVHVRFEEPARVVGVRIREIALVSTDGSWQEAFVSSKDEMHKLARVQDLRVYADSAGSSTGEHQLFAQSSITAKLALHKASGTTSAVEVFFDLGSCLVSADEVQVLALKNEAKERPPFAPRAAWQAAIRAVMARNRAERKEAKRMAWVHARRDEYVSLFKRRLEATRGWLEDPTPRDLAQLDWIERHPNMHFADVARLRKVAYEEVRLEIADPDRDIRKRRKTAEELEDEATKPKKKQGWLSSWWYGAAADEGGSDGRDAVNEALPGPEGDLAKKVQLTEEDREKLFDTIGYDPEEAEHGKAVDPRAIHFQVQAGISSATLQLYGSRTASGGRGQEFAKLKLGALDATLDFEKEIKHVALSASSLHVHDLTTAESGFTDIISPADPDTSTKLMNAVLSRPVGGGALTVDVKLEQALNIVYNAAFVARASQVVLAKGSAPAGTDPFAGLGEPDAGGPGTALGSTWETYQAAYAQAQIEDMWDPDAAPQISFMFIAPTIIVPEDPSRRTSPAVVLDLGAFEIGQQQGAVDAWKLTAAGMKVAVTRSNTDHPELLSDVTLEATLKLCDDRKDLSKPRADVAVVVPRLDFALSPGVLRQAIQIITSNTAASIEVVDEAASIERLGSSSSSQSSTFLSLSESRRSSKPASQAATPSSGRRPSLSARATKETQPSSSTARAPNKAALERLASRVAVRAHVQVQQVRLDIKSDHSNLEFEVAGLDLNYRARTFDSELMFTTTSVRFTDHHARKDLLSTASDRPVLRVNFRTADRDHSPLFDQFTQDVTVTFGEASIEVPRGSVQRAFATFEEFKPASPGLSNSSALIADGPDASLVPENLDTPEDSPPTPARIESDQMAIHVIADSLNLQVEEDSGEVVARFFCGRTELTKTNSDVRLNLRKLALESGADKTPLLTPLQATTSDDSADQFVLVWSEGNGAVLEMDPFHLKLDQHVFQQLASFVPSRPEGDTVDSHANEESSRSETQTQPVEEKRRPASEDGTASTTFDFELRLRNPDAPFRISFVSTDDLRCEMQVDGLAVGRNVVKVTRASMVINDTERVALLEDVQYRKQVGPSGEVSIGRIELVVNPTTRDLTFAAVSSLKSLASATGTSAPSSSSIAPPRIEVVAAKIVTRDQADANDVDLDVSGLRFVDSQLRIRAASLRDPVDGVDAYITHDQGSEDFITGQMSATPPTVCIAKHFDFYLDPKSYAATLALVDLLSKATKLISGDGAPQEATAAEEAAEPAADDESEAQVSFRLEFPSGSARISTFHANLDDVTLSTADGALDIFKDGRMQVNFGKVTLLDQVETPLRVDVTTSDGLMSVAVAPLTEELRLPLSPRSLYMLNSCLKHNLLLHSSERPVYLPPSDHSTSVCLELSIPSLRVSLSQEAASESKFASGLIETFKFNYDGVTNTMILSSPNIRVWAVGPHGTGDRHLLLCNVRFQQTTSEDDDGSQVTAFDVSTEAVWARWSGPFLQRFFDFAADLESMRVENILANDKLLAEEQDAQAYVPHRKTTLRLEIDNVTLIAFGRINGKGSSGEHALVLRTALVAVMDMSNGEETYDRVVQLSLNQAGASSVMAHTADGSITQDYPVVHDVNVLLKITAKFTRTGVRLETKFDVMVERIVVRALFPLFPGMARIVAYVLATKPSRRVVRQAVLDKVSDLEKTGASRIVVRLSVNQLKFVALAQDHPVLRLCVDDTSTVEGESEEGKAASEAAAFNGDLAIRGVSLQCFNPTNRTWEPMLERCDMVCDLSTIPHEDGNSGVQLRFRSSSSVRVNLHPVHIVTLSAALREGHEVVEEAASVAQSIANSDGQSAAATNTTEHLTLGNIGSHTCKVVNFTESVFTVQDQESRPNEELLVVSKDDRLMIKRPEFAREVALVAGDVQVVDNPSLAIYVEKSDDPSCTFLIVLAAATRLWNNTDKAVQVSALQPARRHDVVDNEARSDVLFVLPGNSFYVPSAIAKHCLVEFRLDERDRWHVIELESHSELDDSQRRHAVVGFDYSQAAIGVDIDRRWNNQPVTHIEIRPVQEVVNTLPDSVMCELFRRAKPQEAPVIERKAVLEPGDRMAVYSLDSKDLSFRVAHADGKGGFGPLVPLLRHSGNYEYEMRDAKLGRRQVIKMRSTGRAVEIWAPFWLINATGMDLAYSLDDGTTPLGEPTARAPGEPERFQEETWENQRKYPGRGWCADLLPGERPAWSDKLGNEERLKEQVSLPRHDQGWAWEGEWRTDRSLAESGEDGWQYAGSFIAPNWTPSEGWSDMVRRRRWVRTRARASTLGNATSSGQTHSSSRPRGFGVPAVRVAIRSNASSAPLAWSQPLQLDLVAGTNDVFPLRISTENTSFYELVLSVERHPTMRHVKLCTIAPRLVLINQVHGGTTPLRCMQAMSFQDPIMVEGATPYFWNKPPEKPLLQVQVGSSDWSAPFMVAGLEELCIKVGDTRLCVDVRRSDANGSVLAVFREDDTRSPMYKVQNVSINSITVAQKDVDPSRGVQLGPYCTGAFAWPEPSVGGRKVTLLFDGHPDISLDLDITGVGTERRIALPPLSKASLGDLERPHGGATRGERHQGVLDDCVPAFVVLSGTNEKLVATAPPRQVTALIESTEERLAEQDWTPRFSKMQASAVTIMRIEGGTGGLSDGDTVAVYCTSSDGKQRMLTQREAKGAVGAQHDEEKLLGWRVVEDEEAPPPEEARFVMRGNGSDGSEIRETGGAFVLAAQGDPTWHVSFSHDSSRRGLVLAPASAARSCPFAATHLDSLRDLPRRIAFVNVDIQGSSRVIRITETSIAASSNDHGKSGISTMDIHSILDVGGDELEGGKPKVRLDLSFEFGDFGLSLISDHDPKVGPAEIAYLTADFEFRMLDTNVDREFDLKVKTLRIDNDVPDARYVNLLRRAYESDASARGRAMLHLKLLEKHTQLNVMYVQHLDVTFARWEVQIDEPFLDLAIQVARRYGEAATPQDRRRDRGESSWEYLKPGMDLFAVCEAANRPDSRTLMYYFRQLQIGAIKLKFSFFKNQFTDVERAPITLDPLEMRNFTAAATGVLAEVKQFYSQQIQRHIVKIIGYLLPGNPGELISSLGGTASFDGLLRGAVRGVATIGSLGATLAKLDSDYKGQRGPRPQNLRDGFRQGGKHIGQGFVRGMEGLLNKPREGAESDGFVGAMAGLGKGMFGLVAKPVSGVAAAINSASQGMVAETKSQAELAAEQQAVVRVRPPRFFHGSQRARVLVPFEAQQTAVLRKALRAHIQASSSASGSSLEATLDQHLVAALFLDRLPYFMLHTPTHAVFGTFKGPRGRSGLDTSAPLDERLQRDYAAVDANAAVRILWAAPCGGEATRALHLAEARLAAQLSLDNVAQCEARLQSLHQRDPQGPTAHAALIADVRRHLAASFSPAQPPWRNLDALRSMDRAIKSRGPAEEAERAAVLEAVATGPEVREIFPLVTLCVLRALLANVAHGTAEDAQVLDSVEAAFVAALVRLP